MGSEIYLYGELNGEKVIANVPSNKRIQNNSDVALYLDTNRVHIFDKETEELICDWSAVEDLFQRRFQGGVFMRTSGVLMHISSLPGDGGIGTFGENAYKFVDLLYESGQT